MTVPRLADYIAHLKQAVRDVHVFVDGLSRDRFLSDRRTQQAVMMSLTTIGEISARVIAQYPEFVQTCSAVPWRQMRGMRNRMIHGYFEVDLDVVWQTTQTAIPELSRALDQIDISEAF